MLHIRGHIFKVFKIISKLLLLLLVGISLGQMALMLGVNILLALVKDFGGFRLITICEMFYLFISCSIVLQL